MKTIRFIIAALAAYIYTPAAHAQITADFTATPETACTGSIVSITVNNNQSDYKTAKVEFGDGIDTYGNDLKHIYTSAGTYNISLSLLLNDGTWTAKQTKSVTIGDTPELSLEDNAAAALLTAIVSPGASLSWYRNGNAITNTESTLYYMESGTYEVIATNSNGCMRSESLKVKYEQQAASDDTQIKVANNVITPGVRDGINDVLIIEDADTFVCSVKIFDKKGKLVYTNNKYSNTDGFKGLDDDGNELFAGTYYYVIKSQGKKGCTGFVDLIR